MAKTKRSLMPMPARRKDKELDVRYVLEGSVQREQNRVRVNAQLIDTESGAHIWADRFDKDVADLLKLQDEIVTRLADSSGYALIGGVVILVAVVSMAAASSAALTQRAKEVPSQT